MSIFDLFAFPIESVEFSSKAFKRQSFIQGSEGLNLIVVNQYDKIIEFVLGANQH